MLNVPPCAPAFARGDKQTVSSVPAIRLRDCNDAPVRASGRYVLYWMIASRRVNFNFALDRALEYCRELDKPLVVF